MFYHLIVSKRLLFNLFIIQGKESCDFWQLFCTCIRTERVRNMSIFFHFSTNFHAVKCKSLIFIRSVFMLRAVFSYSSSSKEFHTLLQLVWKKYTVLENDFYIITCCRNYKVSCLPHEKPLSIKEIMINFLTYSARIHVQTVP